MTDFHPWNYIAGARCIKKGCDETIIGTLIVLRNQQIESDFALRSGFCNDEWLRGFHKFITENSKCKRFPITTRVDLHTPKMLIIQFHTSSVWENACHTIFIQFLKMVENWYKLISVAV